MSNTIDIGILELLASKICHDLISPIGAVNNGIEFMAEMGEDAGDEVTDLIAFSANQASSKLKAYRMAYGAGGSDDSIRPEEVFNTIQDIIGAEEKIKQEWDAYGPLGFEDRPKAYCKMLMCAMILAMDCLPKGGKITVTAGQGEQSIITASGENAGVRQLSGSALMLTMPRVTLEPKYVHAYITGLLGKNYGYSFALNDDTDGEVKIIMNLPSE